MDEIAAYNQTRWRAGSGYILSEPYMPEAMITYEDQEWVYDRGHACEIDKPIEYRHTLSSIINGLVKSNFSILHVSDTCDMHPDPNSAPGSWDHFVAYAPPWFCFVARFQD